MFNNFRIRLYLETTVFNYFFDVERPGHEDVVRLFEVIKAGEIRAYTSRYFTDELERAQEPKKSKMLSLIEAFPFRYAGVIFAGLLIVDYFASFYQMRKRKDFHLRWKVELRIKPEDESVICH